MKNVITISGERQSGKTSRMVEMLIGHIGLSDQNYATIILPTMDFIRYFQRRHPVLTEKCHQLEYLNFQRIGVAPLPPCTLVVVDDYTNLGSTARLSLMDEWHKHTAHHPDCRLVIVKET